MRIGIILCTCGTQLEEKIDFNELEKLANDLPDVVIVKRVDMLCKSPEKYLKDLIKVDRILFVGCSERSSLTFNEDRIIKCLKNMGIDPALFEVVNIREQCAWIHDNKEEATRKAKDQMLMAYVKLRSNVKSYEFKDIMRKVLIIGGGVAGLSCAISLAKMGIQTTLVEKKPYIGGLTCHIPFIWQSESYASVCTSECIIPVLNREAMFEENITILTNSEIIDVKKENGNFKVKILKKPTFVNPDSCISCGKCSEVCPVEVKLEFRSRKAIDKDFILAMPDSYNIIENACIKCGECLKVCPTNAIDLNAKPKIFDDTFGAVVIATGFKEERSPFISLTELESLITRKFDGNPPQSIAYILCKKDEAGYCSKLCCPIVVKQVARLAMMYPEMEITVIYKSLRTYGRSFESFRRLAEIRGVEFVQAEVNDIKKVENKFKIITDKGEFEADLVVTPEPFKSGDEEILKLFGVLVDENGFPIEFQPRNLHPSETYSDRIFVIGGAKGFRDVQESVESGRAIAARIYEILNGRIQKFVSVVDESKCSKCGICVTVCPHNAISTDGKIDAAFCKGCGLCYTSCPSKAIELINLEDKQLLDMAEVAFKNIKDKEPRILAFLCYWCSYAAADLMGFRRLKLPASFRSIRVRCSASVNPEVILRILAENKADAVLIAGCPPKNCHHMWGNNVEVRRVKMLKSIMGDYGSRVRWEHIGVAMWDKLAKVLKAMYDELKSTLINH